MADPLDLLTLDEGKAALRRAQADATDDATIALYITAASRAMDDRVHFGPTVRRAVTDELETLNGAGVYTSRVRVRVAPVSAWTSVVEYRQGEATTLVRDEPTVSPASDGFYATRYDPNPAQYSGRIERRYSGYRGQFLGELLVASYTAGRVESTTAVDAQFKRACELVLINNWREREPSIDLAGDYQVPRTSFPAFTIPNAAIEMLQPHWRGGAGGTNSS